MTLENDGWYETHWPLSPRQTRAQKLAQRPATLTGQVVAQLWDYVFHGDRIFAHLEQSLRERYPDIRFVHWREFGNIHSSDEARILGSLTQRFKELGVTAAITGMAC